MSGTCGPTCGMPFARYDPDSSSWRTSEATSLWDLTLSSLTLPPWGCLHGGELSERPTPELRTVEPVSSSSLLPTVTTQDGENMAGPSQMRRHTLPLNTVAALLATPSVVDMGSAYSPEAWEAWRQEQRKTHANGNGHGESLTQQAIAMLPTPKAADGERGRDVARARPDTKSRELATAVGMLPTPRATRGGSSTEMAYLLLPTPRAAEAEHSGRTAPAKPGQQTGLAETVNGLSLGESTSPRSADGSTSLDDQHPHLPFPEPPDATGSTPCSSSG